MRTLQLFLSVDPSLGRVDYSSFSDQTLMEMMFEGFDDETKKENQDSHGMYRDVSGWTCIKCDDEERVIKIEIGSHNVSGSLELRYVPPKVKVLDISSWRKRLLAGSVDLAHLPFGMEYLNLSSNQLSGEIDLTHLPDGMQRLSLQNNQFTGEIDLAQLPDGIFYLDLQTNQLTGEIDFAHLPEGMKYLFLNNNQLSGEIDLTNLPKGMRKLFLENNQFTGEIDLNHLPYIMDELRLKNNHFTGPLAIKRLPNGVKVIDVQGNHFNDIAVVDSKARTIIKLRGSGATSVVDENGKERDMRRFLY